MDRIYIDFDGLNNISNSLKAKGDSILNQYRSECYSALRSGTSCIEMTGLDTDEFFRKLDEIYQQLSEKINGFSTFLTKVVTNQYDMLNQTIANNFNQDIGQRLASLLGMPFASGIGGVITSPVTPTTSSTSSNNNSYSFDTPLPSKVEELDRLKIPNNSKPINTTSNQTLPPIQKGPSSDIHRPVQKFASMSNIDASGNRKKLIN